MKTSRYTLLYIIVAIFAGLVIAGCGSKKKIAEDAESPEVVIKPEKKKKRPKEFRGVWMQTVFQDRYQKMTVEQSKTYLRDMVQMLSKTGFNALLFQVRSEGDAFYKSEMEPWSRFLTGVRGRAPQPEWDPMEYLIEVCHEYEIEFHAWVNPYRMSASKTGSVRNDILYQQHPEWYVWYDNKWFLNPGLPECRTYIRDIVKDIVTRYDVDAIHFDDYFYPYPVSGQVFDDHYAYQTYAPMLGIDMNGVDALGDFRRMCVNILVKSLHEDIKAIDPNVDFGISPFGIYRNKKSWSGGSNTNGKQCYSDLYADVLLWAQSGWIDYLIPQIYWEIGNKAADYQTLCQWWGDNVPEGCRLYIGQSIERSLDNKQNLWKSSKHMKSKLELARKHKNIKGNCFWYAYQIGENQWECQSWLRNYFK